MKRSIIASMMLAGLLAGPAYSQVDPAAAQDNQRSAAQDRDDGGEWGWIGLLGLVGLLGLRHRERDVTVRRTA